jgi:hypothetical protein
MRKPVVVLLAILALAFGFGGVAWADDDEGAGGGGEAAEQAPAAGGEEAPAAGGGDDDRGGAAAGDDDKGGAAAAGDGDKADDGDQDNDGKPDSAEAAADGDKDNDGTPDSADKDDDNDGTPDSADKDDDNDGKADGASADDADGDGTPDAADNDDDNDGTPDSADNDDDNDGKPDSAEGDDHHAAGGGDGDDDDEDEEPYNKFDLDGDGTSDPALEKEWNEAFEGYSANIDENAVDAALDARPEDAELTPSMTVEDFRSIVLLVKKVVLAKMEKKMAKSAAKKLGKFSFGVFVFSMLGLLLLAIPLVLGNKYPGQRGLLFKYSALAAVTFFLTVNLFGGVLYGMKTAQSTLGSSTNPALAIARGTFDTLHDNAEDYIIMGKELFVPTLMQLEGNADQQPAVLMIENGKKIVNDAKVFTNIASVFKKVDFVFEILPIVLFLVSMILFGLAIRPTLTEIIKLPMRAASGGEGLGADTTKNAVKRVFGEVKAGALTIGILILLTLLSSTILGKIVQPALDALLQYFSLAVMYLQFVTGASSGVVFLTLLGVLLFLVMNLATLILSMSFFLGKSPKIFQAKFNEGTPLAAHKRFFQWGIPAVIFVQLFPLIFIHFAAQILDALNERMVSGIADADAIPWTKIMLTGPLSLVVAFGVLFWAARGVAAIKFLATYAVKPKKPKKPKAPATPAEPV